MNEIYNTVRGQDEAVRVINLYEKQASKLIGELTAKHEEETEKLISELEHRIQVMQAYLEGFVIEYLDNTTGQWTRSDKPKFAWSKQQYRVALPVPEVTELSTDKDEEAHVGDTYTDGKTWSIRTPFGKLILQVSAV